MLTYFGFIVYLLQASLHFTEVQVVLLHFLPKLKSSCYFNHLDKRCRGRPCAILQQDTQPARCLALNTEGAEEMLVTSPRAKYNAVRQYDSIPTCRCPPVSSPASTLLLGAKGCPLWGPPHLVLVWVQMETFVTNSHKSGPPSDTSFVIPRYCFVT